MKPKVLLIFPKTVRILTEMGENIKLARLRRNVTAEQLAERAGITRTTLWNIEKGAPSVNFGEFFLSELQDADLIVKNMALNLKRNESFTCYNNMIQHFYVMKITSRF